MTNDHPPPLSMQEYASYMDRGAAASSAAQVEQLRAQLLERWGGDPRAEDLAATLYAYQERLAAREHAHRLAAGHIRSRFESRIERRTC